MIRSLLTLFAIGLAALVGLSIVLSIVGAVFGLAFGIIGLLLFKVLPIALIAYIVLRIIAPKEKPASATDKEWVDS
jgi:hypothetical protein